MYAPREVASTDSHFIFRFQWPRDTGLCVRSLVEAMKQAEAGIDLGYDAAAIERRIKE